MTIPDDEKAYNITSIDPEGSQEAPLQARVGRAHTRTNTQTHAHVRERAHTRHKLAIEMHARSQSIYKQILNVPETIRASAMARVGRAHTRTRT